MNFKWHYFLDESLYTVVTTFVQHPYDDANF